VFAEVIERKIWGNCIRRLQALWPLIAMEREEGIDFARLGVLTAFLLNVQVFCDVNAESTQCKRQKT
jgi:hypothetical protein